MNKISEESVKTKIIDIHGDTILFPKTFKYVSRSSSIPLHVICKKCDRDVYILSNVILDKRKYTVCNFCDNKIKDTATLKHYIKNNFDNTITNVLDLTNTIYVNDKTDVEILCNIHGIQTIKPNYIKDPDRKHLCKGCYEDIKYSGLNGFLQKARQVFSKDSFLNYDFSNTIYINNATEMTFRCNTCETDITILPSLRFDKNTDKTIFCPECSKRTGMNSLERKVANILERNSIEYVTQKWWNNGIRKYQTDFYLPGNAISIECHGLYWHSTQGATRREDSCALGKSFVINHLLSKFTLQKELGIQLLQFYEDEITNKENIIENIILSKVNKKHLLSIGARKTYVEVIPKKEAEEFLNNYHLQGKCTFNISLGLRHKTTNDLLAVMCFHSITSNRGSKDTSDNTKSELVRYAVKDNVSGGASKLLSYYLNTNPLITNIVSYSDNRISNGKLYEVLGFTEIKHVSPSYYYTKDGDRFHKSNFKKDAQRKKFKNFDESLTEYVNANNNGFYQIYDAGKIKFELSLE